MQNHKADAHEQTFLHEECSWIEQLTDDSIRIRINIDLYSTEALFRVCYIFTDRCYLFLQPQKDSSIVEVRCTRKTTECDMKTLVGDFANELINQRVRQDIAAESKTIRQLIVAQAFTEANLFDRELSEISYTEDPKGITR